MIVLVYHIAAASSGHLIAARPIATVHDIESIIDWTYNQIKTPPLAISSDLWTELGGSSLSAQQPPRLLLITTKIYSHWTCSQSCAWLSTRSNHGLVGLPLQEAACSYTRRCRFAEGTTVQCHRSVAASYPRYLHLACLFTIEGGEKNLSSELGH